jgi:hypothetical protein
MVKTPSAKPAGEIMFERYLAENRLGFRYQPTDLGHPKRPDYLVDTRQGKTLVEVADFLMGEVDKPVAANLAARRRPIEGHEGAFVSVAVGTLDLPAMHQRVRDKIDVELTQLRPYCNAYPCMVVLHNGAGGVIGLDLDDLGITSALSGYLTPEMNTVLSAVAVLKMVQPHEHLFGQAIRSLRKSRGQQRKPWTWPTHEELIEGIELHERVDREWNGMMTEVHPHLVVYHNPYAADPLQVSALPGPHDVAKRLVPDGNAGFKAFDIPRPKR